MRKTPYWSHRVGLLVLVVYLLYAMVGCAPSARPDPRANERYRLAQQYLGTKSYLLAEQEIRAALDTAPYNPSYAELLALIYQAQGRFGPADEAYRVALKQDDVSSSVRVNYSTLLLLRDRDDEAIAMAQQALQDARYGKPALAHTNIGLGYLKKGALLRAEEHLRTALEYQPTLPEAHHNLGLVYARSGKRAQAILSFREAIRTRPAYAEAYANLGRMLLQDGHYHEARDALERVIDLAPDSALAVASQRQLKRLIP